MSIKIDHLSHTYSKKTPYETTALSDVSLTIEKGEFVALVGKTGSGKSTLVQHLNGLIIPELGEVEIDEFKIFNKKRKNKKLHDLRKHVGLVFQFPEYQLFEETIEKDVSFGPKNFGVSDKEALEIAHQKIKEVGFDESYNERSPFELSGGEKRRIAFAGILALDPDILVLDEPTAGLDPSASSLIMSLIKSFNDQGKTVIVVTHDMDLVSNYASRVIYLKDGKVAFNGDPQSFFLAKNETNDIELPLLYEFAKSLNEVGISINLTSIRSVDDLVKELIK